MAAGMEVLQSGGSAVDAVEAACRMVEDNLEDHSVGTGGYPNADGDVELDASLMEGTTRRAGAVAALKNYPNPISIARAMMERLPRHVLLAGDGAALFAAAQGFATRELLTEPAAEAFRQRKFTLFGEEYAFDGTAVSKVAVPEQSYGTVNFLALDGDGKMASAVSTSGWAFKYPGRVGDSPLIGAGNYCDDRYGACACTGLGEWAIRAGTARDSGAGDADGTHSQRRLRAGLFGLACHSRRAAGGPGHEPGRAGPGRRSRRLFHYAGPDVCLADRRYGAV